MVETCNKCRQSAPHLSDSWCLSCSAVEALTSELRLSWGLSGTRALADDYLATAVRHIRALRRLGVGAEIARAPAVTGAGTSRASAPRSHSKAPQESTKIPSKDLPPEVKREEEPNDEESGGSEEPESEEEETEDDKAPAAAAKSKPAHGTERNLDRSPVPRRRTSDRGADRVRLEERRTRKEDTSHTGDRSSRRSRSTRRAPPRKREGRQHRRTTRTRPGHRGGARHQRVHRAAEEPFRRFHTKLPEHVWDRPPTPP